MGHDARLNPHSKETTVELNASTLDARGRVLQEGDEIILNIRGPIYFRVANITPILDPNAPANMLQVHVAAILTFTAKRGAMNNEFIRVRTAEEAGPQQFKMLDAIHADDERKDS